MPCYNAHDYLEQAVDSVMAQSLADLELVIVDDGSDDGSPATAKRLAQRHSGRIMLLGTQRQGPYPARNAGLARAAGEFVAFLDADDYWASDFLAKLHSALARTDAALAYCGWQNVGATDRTNEPYVPPDYEAGDKLELLLRAASPWPIHAALVRRSALDEAGGFDTTLATCMDYDLWLRIGAARSITRVPEVLAYYRFHTGEQITSKQWRQAENVWRVKRKFVTASPQLVARFSRRKLQELIDGALLRRGYDCYWRRDLVSAHRIFRRSLRAGGWEIKDLKYLLPALLPEGPYRSLVTLAERRGT
ncbi:MAG TPA: glycosyltransferase [Casimicrobiaceae bacterium]|nr:glycosyltransferase [Casimicrobiaceae bacterium]